MAEHTVASIARFVGARVEGDGDAVLSGVAPLGQAGPGDLTFLERPSLVRRLEGSRPGALLVRDGVELPPLEGALLRVDHPEAAFARAVPLFHAESEPPAGVHETAVVEPDVAVGSGVSVGPHAVIQRGARIGDRSRIGPSVLVGEGAVIGNDCRIGHAASILSAARLGDRVVVGEGARIGTDGYGFATTPEGALKIPQIGRCRIGDDVEIGANCTVDRGALGDTVIGARTKLDNLVHIAHNVEIGSDCMIVAQVGIAGSSRIGDGVGLAGQAGVAGHLTIGDGARIAARAAVFKDVPPGATYSGTPARPHRTVLKAQAATLRLPEALERLSELERRVDGDGDAE